MNSRKPIRFVFPELQRRFVSVVLAFAGSSVVIGACAIAITLSRLSGKVPNDGDVIAEAMPSMILMTAAISLAVAIPVFATIALSMTMPLMGALYRLRKFLQETADGTEVNPCKLRSGDPLQEICTLLNEATTEQRRSNAKATKEQPKQAA